MIVQKATQSNIHTADIIYLAELRLILRLQQPRLLQRWPCGIAPRSRNVDKLNPAKRMWWVRPWLALKARYDT